MDGKSFSLNIWTNLWINSGNPFSEQMNALAAEFGGCPLAKGLLKPSGQSVSFFREVEKKIGK